METNWKKSDVVDNYYGVNVPDPYRWLENSSSEDTIRWTRQQNIKTDHYLQSHPDYFSIKNRITALTKYKTYTIPQKIGDHYYFHRNKGKNNQPNLSRGKSVAQREPALVLH